MWVKIAIKYQFLLNKYTKEKLKKQTICIKKQLIFDQKVNKERNEKLENLAARCIIENPNGSWGQILLAKHTYIVHAYIRNFAGK